MALLQKRGESNQLFKIWNGLSNIPVLYFALIIGWHQISDNHNLYSQHKGFHKCMLSWTILWVDILEVIWIISVIRENWNTKFYKLNGATGYHSPIHTSEERSSETAKIKYEQDIIWLTRDKKIIFKPIWIAYLYVK